MLRASVVFLVFSAFVLATLAGGPNGAGIVGGVHYAPCRTHPPARPQPNKVYEYCPNAVVNGVSVKCREYWIRKAAEVQFNGSAGTENHLCPLNFFGSVVVNHSDTNPNNPHDEDGNNCGAFIGSNTGAPFPSVDEPTQHGEINATREVGKKFPGNGRNRAFWRDLTQYTTGEPCGMCATHQVFAGYKEIVYSVRVGDFINMGLTQVAINSMDIYSKQALFNPTSPTVIIRDVLREEFKPYFSWRYNNWAPCPAPCVDNPAGPYRCKMPSS